MKNYLCKKTLIIFIISLFLLNSNTFAEKTNNKKNSGSGSKNFKTYRSDLLLLKNYYLYDLSPKSHSTLFPDENEDNNASYKSPWLAFGLAISFPGLGQIYNGEYNKLVIIYGTAILGAGISTGTMYFNSYKTIKSNNYIPVVILAGLVLIVGSWLYSIIDAPISAIKINSQYKHLSGTKAFSPENVQYSIDLDYQNLTKTYLVKMQLSF